MIFFLILFIPFCLLIDNIEGMTSVISVLLIIDIGLNYITKNKISYLDIWNLGFLFMVCSEMILSSEILYLQEYGLKAVRYIFIANILFNIGFRVLIKRTSVMDTQKEKHHKLYILREKKLQYVLLILAITFFLFSIESALTRYTFGRASQIGDTLGESSDILSKFIIGVGYFVPIAAAFYFRYYYKYKQKLIFLLIFLLCLTPQILAGTRYLLLFSLVAPLIILLNGKKLSPKLLMGCFISFCLVVFLTSYMKHNRDNRDNIQQLSNIESKQKTLKQLASLGSDENIVKRANQLFQYTNDNGYHYGKESAFILYFWMPRQIWPEKPTKIGHWLVRKYERVSDKFSAAYGFWGQLFIDFGYLSLPILFILGGIVRKLDIKKDFHLNQGSKISILYVALFPVFFFSIRSPQTAMINFVIVVLTYIILIFLLKKLGFINKRKHSIKTLIDS